MVARPHGERILAGWASARYSASRQPAISFYIRSLLESAGSFYIRSFLKSESYEIFVSPQLSLAP